MTFACHSIFFRSHVVMTRWKITQPTTPFYSPSRKTNSIQQRNYNPVRFMYSKNWNLWKEKKIKKIIKSAVKMHPMESYENFNIIFCCFVSNFFLLHWKYGWIIFLSTKNKARIICGWFHNQSIGVKPHIFSLIAKASFTWTSMHGSTDQRQC